MGVQGIKSILIGVSPELERPSAAAAYGLSLARSASAHASISALSPEMTLTHAFVSSTAAGLVAAENRRLLEQARAAVEKIRQDAMAQGVSCSSEAIQKHYALLASSFTKRVRTHDLVIVDAEPDSLSLRRGLLEEALFNGGRPMLVIPPNVETFRVQNILVAWDGSAKATRAVNDALPFLRAADHVEVLSVIGEKDMSRSVPGADLAPHLARHGVNCTVKDLSTPNGDAAEIVRSQAAMNRADLIVMGAYVHSRLRQLVLGGVTQAMLRDCSIPLMLSY
ncbi:universal stress protein [Microvirga thermotolerans]|uniref:Universal stress protein n=1 Tax=Microvirga thermotolerans TaxID=2651334 RepID=A0A5P9K0Z2_9HYPH|nr:universal stress protein [Microvirga thermotolerans]QFU17698.1 universal stress protein [Microvirga thermotolerans]